MDKRSLLFGFGAGVAFAAGFMLVFPAQGPTAFSLTKEQLQAAAEANQMVLVPKQEYEKWQQHKQSEAPVTPPSAPGQPTAPAVQLPSAAEPSQPQAPAAPQPQKPAGQAPATHSQPLKPTGQPPTAPSAPKPTVSFTVKPGMTSTDVARGLVQAGVLPPDSPFVEKLREQKKLNRIRSGIYTIPKGIPVDELIRLLTTPPKS
ncbi:hypothetical protein G3578_02475 [Brevibacillus sp. SYP-B805]|uniref:hypothetical protein n=1 Tax=Brevibacillus sp. SYP-B805 TaxID=1578199 RepID=UPI0013ECA8E9|nr:hypothetical protein [Brevibacillus sp. SYP-B805]NGQ94037.1 hypothetical protein [Brevibacillus sp. SYP-B805]